MFAGKPLPEGYDPDTHALVDREVLAVLEVVEKDGVSHSCRARWPSSMLCFKQLTLPGFHPQANFNRSGYTAPQQTIFDNGTGS